MIYPFWCKKCECYKEAVRPVAEASNVEACPKCGGEMKRLYTAPQISINNNTGYYNYGLGIWVNGKHDISDRIKQIADGGVRMVSRTDEYGKKYVDKVIEPGREVVEVGNEYKAAKVNRRRSEYTVPREVLAQMGA